MFSELCLIKDASFTLMLPGMQLRRETMMAAGEKVPSKVTLQVRVSLTLYSCTHSLCANRQHTMAGVVEEGSVFHDKASL